ncbi:IS110 family transposase, partial [Mycobacterium tuberculosis]|uniref:IS110 family transposase n=1 Tax=Mycobacterium tuberculosis TaxID=1773 RepID=UPI0019326E28
MQCRAREERPGRKTDLLDAEWLVHLLECGLLRGWLIPPADIKAARDVIRYRRKLVEHRTSKLQRLGNVLQDAGIKADSVASSVTPKSVRAMVEALIDGERRPAVLADLARGSMRSKIPDLQRALEGRFDDYRSPWCRGWLVIAGVLAPHGPGAGSLLALSIALVSGLVGHSWRGCFDGAAPQHRCALHRRRRCFDGAAPQ